MKKDIRYSNYFSVPPKANTARRDISLLVSELSCPTGKGKDTTGRLIYLTGKGSNPTGRGIDPTGRVTSVTGRDTDPTGRGNSITGRGNDVAGAGQRHNSFVHYSYFLSPKDYSLGDLYDSIGQQASGQGEKDNSRVPNSYSLSQNDYSLGNLYGSRGQNTSGQGIYGGGKPSRSSLHSKVIPVFGTQASGVSTTLKVSETRQKRERDEVKNLISREEICLTVASPVGIGSFYLPAGRGCVGCCAGRDGGYVTISSVKPLNVWQNLKVSERQKELKQGGRFCMHHLTAVNAVPSSLQEEKFTPVAASASARWHGVNSVVATDDKISEQKIKNASSLPLGGSRRGHVANNSKENAYET